MTTLADVADMLRKARRQAGFSQEELAQRAGVARTTVARMETVAKGDMSVSALIRLLETAGYDLQQVKHGHTEPLKIFWSSSDKEREMSREAGRPSRRPGRGQTLSGTR